MCFCLFFYSPLLVFFLFFFFFLMIRRPPRSTLFPTRRSSDLCERIRARRVREPGRFRHVAAARQLGAGALQRSEEHTSELQSRPHLVCRLLLEKKKKLIERRLIRRKKKARG